MRRAFGFVSLSLILASACSSGPSYSAPTTPTASQMSAATMSQNLGDSLRATKVLSNPNNIYSVYATMSSVGPAAQNPGGKKDSALTLEPEEFPSSCVTGDSTTGFTYTNCVSSSVTFNGSVKASGGTVNVDISIATSGAAANTKTTMKGAVTATETTITGDMNYEISVDLGLAGSLGGVGNAGNVSTHVNWNVTNFQTTPEPCVTAGAITIDYTAANVSNSALFQWTGCGMLTVQNGS